MSAEMGDLLHGEREYIEKLMARRGRRSFRAKQCYANAQRLILADTEKRLRYWEGTLHCECFSIPHAWITIRGKVVDVTHEAAQLKEKRFGLPLETVPPQ